MKTAWITICILSLLACGGKKEEAAAGKNGKKNGKPPLVETAPVERGDIRHSSAVTATLEAERQVEVIAETVGIVEEIPVEEGRRVARGDLLVRLKHADEEMAVRRARVEFDHQEGEMARARTLFEQGLSSNEALAQVQYLFDQARVALDDAVMRLEKTQILAPFAGTLAKRHVHVGQQVQVFTPLFTLTDNDPLLARVYLPEEVAVHLRPGAEVEGVAREGEVRFRSVIDRVSPVVDPRTGTVEIVLAVRGDAEGLRPGSFATFTVYDRVRPDAVLLPARALVSELDQNWVFVINDGKAHKRDVKVGWRSTDRVEVLEGLEGGEAAVVVGKEGLKDGLEVRVAP